MVFVLDAAVFINRLDVGGVTVQSVVEEVRGDEARLFLETHFPEVREPGDIFVSRVRGKAGETGDLPVLSETDVELLGLSLELKVKGEEPVVLTDDFAVQNVASVLGIEFRPVVGRGISDVVEWEWFCSACGEVFSDGRDRCRVCGSELRRRARR